MPSNRDAEDADPIMPFGKYAGLKISEVPTDYLKWAIREGVLPGDRPLGKAAIEELENRRTRRL